MMQENRTKDMPHKNAPNTFLRCPAKLKRGIAALGMLAALSGQPLLRADDAAAKQQANDGISVSSAILDTTQYTNNAVTTQGNWINRFKWGSDELMIVGGPSNTFNLAGVNTHTDDLSAKFTGDLGMMRFTYYNDMGNASFGPDIDMRLVKARGWKLYALGDISSVRLSTDKVRHTDFGIGGRLNRGNHNIFFIRSDRMINAGRSKQESSRFGYSYESKDRLAAFMVDQYSGGVKNLYSGYLGFHDFRLVSSYNANTRVFSESSYLTYHSPLPDYAITTKLSDNNIYTVKSILDSDNTSRYATPPPTYLRPTGRFGDILKFKYNRNPADKKFGYDFDAYNASMVKLTPNTGIVVTQNLTVDTKGIRHEGGGIGYMFLKERLVPVAIWESHGLITFNLGYTFRGRINE
jgi:hypothetical protein